MAEAIGIRLDKNFLKKIEKLSKEEVLDRSSTIRKLVYLGYQNLIKKKNWIQIIKNIFYNCSKIIKKNFSN